MRSQGVTHADLPVLADLIRELGYIVTETKIPGGGQGLRVELGDEKSTLIGIGYGCFMVLDRIPKLNTFFFGHGPWDYVIEI